MGPGTVRWFAMSVNEYQQRAMNISNGGGGGSAVRSQRLKAGVPT